MWWVWSGNVKPTVLQQWRLRSPLCMNHCAPRVIAKCDAHKKKFACTRTRSGPFPRDPDRKALRKPTLFGGTPKPFLDKLRKSLNQISKPEKPWYLYIYIYIYYSSQLQFILFYFLHLLVMNIPFSIFETWWICRKVMHAKCSNLVA